MGGVYPSTQPRLALTSRADFIVKGEGESALLEIAEGKAPGKITGVFAGEEMERETFPQAPVIENLDDLPFPDYDIPGIDQYFRLSPRGRRGKIASIITSRGCPYNCEFCSIHPVYGRNWRGRSPEHVLDRKSVV